MTKDRNDGTDDVGFGKPPKHSQFQRGQSGNPKGRPKGSLNLATMLERTLRERVVLKENGRRKVVTKLESVILKLVNDAASGNSHSTRLLCQLLASGEERSIEVEPATPFTETDQKVLDNIRKRIQQTFKEGNNGTDQE
jgi:uncharacterized protein DUF5681